MNKIDAIFAIGMAHKALVAELATTATTATTIHPDDHMIVLYCAGMCRGLLSTADCLRDTICSESILEELYKPLVQLACKGVLAEPWSGKVT